MCCRLRDCLIALLAALAVFGFAEATGDKVLRVSVLENSPPMAFRDANGELTGFSVGVIRAVCAEMRVVCKFQVTTLESVLDEVANGEVDVVAVSLLNTPERRARLIFSKPYFRSVSLWFAKPGIQPGQPGVRIAVVHGSAQERFARSKAWETVGVRTNGELAEPLIAGLAKAAIIPMSTSLNLMKQPGFQQLGLVSVVMNEAELGGDAAFGISPRRPELKEPLDAAIDRIKRNGTYDRINSQFLPFRVN